MRTAIIDLGTNTCNLLIAETGNGRYHMLYRGKKGVKLGKEGIGQNNLNREAFMRARQAFLSHRKTIQDYGTTEITALATSAVRDAVNRQDFSDYLLRETGLNVRIITGEEEAELIFEGVKLALGNIPPQSLILDIGGGSNEFILPGNNTIKWKNSFPLGMARVTERFPLSDPARPEEIRQIETYYENGLSLLWTRLDACPVNKLIGCAGAFDTLADLTEQTPAGTKTRIRKKIRKSEFGRLAQQLIHSTTVQRNKLTGMDPLRVEMIVPAVILIRLLFRNLGIRAIIQTSYALAEGVLSKHINGYL
ncbi:MAG: phosphatase [Mangrovibacterium sp.]